VFQIPQSVELLIWKGHTFIDVTQEL
jgi:hypothetical protein